MRHRRSRALSQRAHRILALAAVSAVTAALVGVPALSFGNSTANQIWGGFQIDGNLTAADYGTGSPTVPPPAGTVDWDSAQVQTNAAGDSQPQPAITDPIGAADGSVYSNGSKEGDNPDSWTINTSAGATSKGDMGNIYFWSHIAPNGHIYGYMGIERVSTSGTVDYFVELNQKANHKSTDGTVSVPDRSTNDIRLQITDHGSTGWNVTATGDRWSCPTPVPAGSTCNSTGSWAQDQSLSNDFYGLVNDGTITDPAQFNSAIAAQNTPSGKLVANQFTEFSIDLTAAGYVPDSCGASVFAQLNLRSVSSLSSGAELKDFAQGPIQTSNPCAKITVTKKDMAGTTITGNAATFTFSPDPTLLPTAPNYASSTLTVTDGASSGVCSPVRTPCPGDSDGSVNGVVTLTTVQVGATNIQVTESSPPSGYFADPTPQTIAGPTAGSTTYPLTFHDPLGTITWQKWDSSTSAPVTVAGATFTVTATGGAAFAAPWSTVGHPFTRTVVDNGTNDDDSTVGQLSLSGLPAGTYTITETVPPSGYLLPQPPDDAITGVSVASATAVDAGHFTDGFGSLAWHKTDTGGTPLGGATFQVEYPDGSLYNVVDNTGATPCTPAAYVSPTPGTVCDSDVSAGNFSITGLKTGDYTITETVAPTGYTLSPNVLTGTITDTSWSTVNAGTVQDGQGSMEWFKVGPDGVTPLGGAVFRLDGPSGFSELVTDNGLNDTSSVAGDIKVTGLAPGDYTITEVTPPTGYLLPTSNSPALSATVPSTGTTTVQAGTITDPLGSLVWHKVGPDGTTALGGATFEVTGPNGFDEVVVDDGSLDVDKTPGTFELDGLMAGDYTVTETVPPTGYLLPATGNPLTATIHITDNTGAVDAGTVTDPLGAISWTKVGPGGLTPVGGATFEVTGPNGYDHVVVDNGPLDANSAPGVFEVDGLMTGDYTITETIPPPGYLMPTTGNPLTATVTSTSNTGPVSAGVLSDPLGGVSWTKFGPDGITPLGGATFQITFPNDDRYDVVDYTGTGACAPQPVNGTTPGTLCDQNAAAGQFEVDGLMTGDYTITETSPPPGYLLPPTGNPLHATITVNDNTGAVAAGSVTDPLGAIGWEKLNSRNHLPVTIAGAKFTLVGTAGAALAQHFSKTVVDNGSNDADTRIGHLKVVDVPTGTYTITEIAAPRTFVLPSTGRQIKGVVVTTTSWTTVNAGSISDPPYLPIVSPGNPTLPDTGGPDLTWFIVGGGLLIAGLVLVFVARRRRTE